MHPSKFNSQVILAAGLIITGFAILEMLGGGVGLDFDLALGSPNAVGWLLLASGAAVLLGRNSRHPVVLLAAALGSILPAMIAFEGFRDYVPRTLEHFVTFHTEHCFALLAAIMVWWSVLLRMLRGVPREKTESSGS